MSPKGYFGHIFGLFSCFSANFSYFLGEAKTNIFPIFFLFRAGRPENPVLAGGQGRKARGQNFMCCVRNPRNINIFVRVPGREDR